MTTVFFKQCFTTYFPQIIPSARLKKGSHSSRSELMFKRTLFEQHKSTINLCLRQVADRILIQLPLSIPDLDQDVNVTKGKLKAYSKYVIFLETMLLKSVDNEECLFETI